MGNKAMKTDGKTGRWSAEEHIRFLQGLIKHGKNWKLVQRHVNMTFQPTNSSEKGLQRSGPQIRSHAQKFFKRILPNCLIGETPIQCLIRNNFSIDLIVSGIEDTQEKEDLKEKLEEKLQDFPKWDWDNFAPKKVKTQGVIKSENSDSKSFKRKCSIESESIDQPNDVIDTNSNDQGFTYFPSAYKMATVEKSTPPTQCNQDSFKFKRSLDSSKKYSTSTWVQLSSEDPVRSSIKRKHSEMVSLEKLERVDVSAFHMPTPLSQENAPGNDKMNKREEKLHRRQRTMTETVQDFQGRVGFCPTKKSEQTLSCIEILRNDNIPKPQISSVLSMHKFSIDETGSVISASGKRTRVKLLKGNKDLNSNSHGLNRLRLQTF